MAAIAPRVGVRERLRSLSPRHLLRTVLGRLFPYVTAAVLAALDPAVLAREDLGRVARRDGALFEYGEPETYVIEPPASPPDPDGIIAERVGSHSLPRPFVCELRGCRLVGPYPLALTDRNEVVLEAVVRPVVLVLNVLWSAAHLLANPGRLRALRGAGDHLDTACLLYNAWSSGYFHWTYESLIRLEGVERYRERTGRAPTLVLGPDPPAWQRETLELLGYDADDWIEWDGGTATVDRLVVPSVRRTAVLSPGAVNWLRERVRTRLAADDSLAEPDDFPDRVYVSRADADGRRVVNEDAVVDVLSDHGFSRFVLSELSVPEQAALFAGAEVVVAPHGAGLANLAYADDPVVVELFADGDVRGQYFQLASVLGFEYHYRVGARVGDDMRVDVEALRDVLAGIDGVRPGAADG